MCPFLKLFWSVFSHIRTEYGEIWSTSSYSVRMLENTDQNNSKYGHFSRSDRCTDIGRLRCKSLFTTLDTKQKMKFPIKDFSSKCDQIHSFLWILSYLLKKSLTENFIFLYSEKFRDTLMKW